MKTFDRSRPGIAAEARRDLRGALEVARRHTPTAVPFGPMLALGGLAGVLVGGDIVDWYLRTFT